MNSDTLPTFSVGELNKAIGNLLSRGFAPRFLLHASVLKAQLKNGHMWLTLTDGKASITAVIWASSFSKLTFSPKEEDGVEIVGKLNFWENRASLVVQVIDIRPTLSTVLRQFEVVRSLLSSEGLIDERRHRELPAFPSAIAICTSVPSSAYADMLRMAKERWPIAKLFVFPIPVQGKVLTKIQSVLTQLSNTYIDLGIEALVLARGGGSREDLMIFDQEDLCRQLANFPIPVITGIGHEDDLTVADLVADHRSATPTASIVDLLPSKEMELNNCMQKKERIQDYFNWMIKKKHQEILERRKILETNLPLLIIKNKRQLLANRTNILNALSPQSLLSRGYCLVHDHAENKLLKSIKDIHPGNSLLIEFSDGFVKSLAQSASSKK